MKELPRVYVNPIEKEFRNVQTKTNAKEKLNKLDVRNLSMKIKDIFNSSNYIYKKKVKITLQNTQIEEVIVGKTKDYLLTYEGKKIRINDIYDIEYA